MRALGAATSGSGVTVSAATRMSSTGATGAERARVDERRRDGEGSGREIGSGAWTATSKAAAIHYTRCLAAQLRPFNVTANSIAPGDTRTGRFLNTRAVDPNRMAEGGTLERIALVDEVARAVGVFVGPTGDFITGQVLRVDGGGQCWPA